MPPLDLPLPLESGALRLSPTDVSHFIRLDQCERYLRIRLYEHLNSQQFFRDHGVRPQPIPPLLTRSGRRFEERVEREIGGRCPSLNFAAAAGRSGNRPPDNERLLQAARDLPTGAALVLFQPRLQVDLEGWRLTGDADVVRLERGADGALAVLIADIKSSTSVKVEHRLQVGFYHAILAALFEGDGQGPAFRTGILYAGPADYAGLAEGEEQARLAADADAAERLFGLGDAFLEVVADPEVYLESVRDLVTGPDALARRVVRTPLAELPYHLSFKCDGCVNNELCMKATAEADDLCLVPHLTPGDRSALARLGIRTTADLARLKEPAGSGGALLPAPGKEDLCRRAAVTWPVGPRLDELVHRARRYRKWAGEPLDVLNYIPSKGYGSLPYADAEQNPNLVRVFIDAQTDYLNDRLYMVGARVVACEGGEPVRGENVVRITAGPPESAAQEEALLVDWIRATLRAVVALAAPDELGERRAPVHLVFYNALEQQMLLQALARHFGSLVREIPALYDFVTQLAAFDSPVGTFLDAEIRELKNYPMLCQSLQAVASHLGFNWNEPLPFREVFRARLFDHAGNLEPGAENPRWYTARARFGSMIPAEYAYAAWGELREPAEGERDEFADYRGATIELLMAFQARRLEAMERIAQDFSGNRHTQKRPFQLPDLAAFAEQARSMVQALDEFLTIERHVELGMWKTARHAAPERRVLGGETLLLRFLEADQDLEVIEANREHLRRHRLKQEYELAYRALDPDVERPELTKEEKEATRWSQTGMRFRFRLDAEGLDCSLAEALALNTWGEGDRLVVYPRLTEDERLPFDQRQRFTPTPRQMLYGTRADVTSLQLERDEAGTVVGGTVELQVAPSIWIKDPPGYVFGAIDRPFVDGERYTLDPDPNSWYGYYLARTVQALLALDDPAGRSTVYDRLTGGAAQVEWPAAAAAGQARFLAGLDALAAAGALGRFEPAKRDYLGGRGDAPVLLVQGPPGTGKSYSTAFAIFARLQGALAADRDYRVFIGCKTHSATDVLLAKVRDVHDDLRALRQRFPEIWAEYFDPRLLEVPLFRIDPRETPPDGVTALAADGSGGGGKAADAIQKPRWCVAATTPASVYKAVNKKWGKDLFGHFFCDCLILDEASQMNLPEAIMAALALKPDGQLVVVGDHRQMPPIVQHDWAREPRRTFQEYQVYRSLFEALLPLEPPVIRFAESFRLHADMAEFLRREVYHQDGIEFHSNRRAVLPPLPHADPFLAAVLSPEHPLVVVLHDEAGSQKQNRFEESLLRPILEALADPERYGLGPEEGLGVVVPHRAQRAALQLSCPCLTVLDPATGLPLRSAVDTVERFQGGERTAIVVSATESDREYLLAASEFLLDPRRLTVAVSRAKQKLVLVASRSVFSLFSPDEETFLNSQLWKNLLRRTCTVPLWEGYSEGTRVQVWGNSPSGFQA